MRKRLGSILLVLAMVMSLLPTAVFAAAGDYDADIVATRFNTVQYNGKDTMKLDFMMKTSNGAKVRGIQTALLAIDLNKYAVLQVVSGSVYDRTSIVSTGSTVTKSYAYTTYYDVVNDISVTAKNTFLSSGTKLLMTFEADFGANDVSITESTSMMSILLGLKDGADWASLSSDSVRLATAAEAKTFNATGALTVNPSTGSQLVFRPQNGTSDTLTNEPTVSASGFDFVKPALPNTASVAIGGTAKFGQTLTATASGYPDDAGALTYKWYRGETLIEGESTNQYVIDDAADVGKNIKVEVSAANYSGKMEATTSAKVAKADGGTAPGAPTLDKADATSVTLTKLDGYEYSKDGTSWQTSNEFTGLTPNTEYSFYLRVKATDTHEASAASAALKVRTAKANADDTLKDQLKAAVTAYNSDYDGAAHDAFTVGALPTGWSVSGYSGSETGTFSAAMPKVTDVADSKTLYVKFSNPDYSDVVLGYAVKVNAKDISGAEITLGTQNTYNGSTQNVVISSVKVDGKTLTTSDYDITANGTASDVERKSLTITGKGNYTGEKTTTETWSLQPKNVTATMIEAIGSQTYTGSAIAPALTVKDGETTLTEAAYTVSYENNTYVGTATAKITGKGNYTGEASKTFQITPAAQTPTITDSKTLAKGGNTLDLSALVTGVKGDAAVSFSIASGSDYAELQSDGKTLKSKDTTGEVKISVHIAEVNVDSAGAAEYQAYTATGVITVSVTNKTVNADTMTVTLDGWTYGDTPKTPVVTDKPSDAGTVTYKYSGTDGTTYAESTAVPANAGTYTVTATCETADTIYTATNTFTIARKSISGAAVTLGTALTYNGGSQTQAVSKVELGSVDITSSCTVSDNTGMNAGSYTLTVTANENSNYTGSVTKDFTIAPKTVTPTITVSGSYTYTGSAITPTYTVKADGNTLTDADYSVRFENNINAGTAKIIVTAKPDRNYTWTSAEEQTFTIGKADPAVPTGLTGRIGNKLSSVKLPAGWSWVAGDTYMTALGENQFAAKYEDTTGNYNNVASNLTVTVSNKIPQYLNVPDSIDVTYGDTNVSIAPTGAHGTVSYGESSDVVDVDANGKVTILKAGSATVSVTTLGDADYDLARKNVTINVSRKALTVTAKDQSINVNGTLPDLTKADAYTVTGLVNGDTVDVSLNYAETPDVTKTGSYDIVVTAKADDSKYELTTQNGTLTISQRAISGVTISNYSITVEKAENGAVKADRSVASAGATVTLTADPAKGYTLETLTVLDKNGKEVKLTAKGGKYTFTMPASNVVVKNTFMEDNSMLNFFVDVPASKYFYDAVLWAVKNDITGGVDENHFAPYASCTRGQLVTFLWRAAGEPAAKGDTSFSDVAKGRYCEKSVAWAAENGIVGGYNDGSFRPDATITRQQTAAILWRFAKYAKMDVSVGEDTNILSFTDALSISEYAFPGIQWAVGAGVMQGNDGALLPHDSCTRAQIVTFLYRLLSK